ALSRLRQLRSVRRDAPRGGEPDRPRSGRAGPLRPPARARPRALRGERAPALRRDARREPAHPRSQRRRDPLGARGPGHEPRAGRLPDGKRSARFGGRPLLPRARRGEPVRGRRKRFPLGVGEEPDADDHGAGGPDRGLRGRAVSQGGNLMRLRAVLLATLLAAPVTSQQTPPRWPMFRRHTIDPGANESVAVADVNRDGRLDIIAGENWFEAPDWKKHRMREIPVQSGYIDDLSNFALDCNGDGYPDVIASSWFAKKLSWYENPGAAGGDPLWKEHVIETGFNYELILLVDVDGDGRAEEILPNYGNSPEVAWWSRRGAEWER